MTVYEIEMYEEMWKWIKDNLEELREECEDLYEAQRRWWEKEGDGQVRAQYGDSILCKGFDYCYECPLCVESIPCFIFRKVLWYWSDIPCDLEEAQQACDVIIGAHVLLKEKEVVNGQADG